MAWEVTADVDRYDEALEWFLGRTILPDEERGRIPASARSRAFWIAGAAQLDVVQGVFDEIGKALEKGEPFEAFQKRVRDKLTKAWGKDDPHRIETIFRNAAQSSYNAGRYRQMTEPSVLRFRPFWMVDAVLDTRTTPYCREVDGTILHAEDPWWDTHWFPAHHRCRTSVRNMRRTEAERRGITPIPPATQPADGWGLSPRVATEWRPDSTGRDAGLLSELDRKVATRKTPGPPPPRRSIEDLATVPDPIRDPLHEMLDDDFVEALEAHTAGLTKAQRDAIEEFSGGNYGPMREAQALDRDAYFRANRQHTDAAYDRNRKQALRIDDAIKNHGAFSQTPTRLYRGIAVPRSVAADFVNAEFVKSDRITSTSYYSRTGWRFAHDNVDGANDTRLVFVIDLKNPRNTLPVEHISTSSHEGEVLVGAGKWFRVKRVERTIVDNDEVVLVHIEDLPLEVMTDPERSMRLSA